VASFEYAHFVSYPRFEVLHEPRPYLEHDSIALVCKDHLPGRERDSRLDVVEPIEGRGFGRVEIVVFAECSKNSTTFDGPGARLGQPVSSNELALLTPA